MQLMCGFALTTNEAIRSRCIKVSGALCGTLISWREIRTAIGL